MRDENVVYIAPKIIFGQKSRLPKLKTMINVHVVK